MQTILPLRVQRSVLLGTHMLCLSWYSLRHGYVQSPADSLDLLPCPAECAAGGVGSGNTVVGPESQQHTIAADQFCLSHSQPFSVRL